MLSRRTVAALAALAVLLLTLALIGNVQHALQRPSDAALAAPPMEFRVDLNHADANTLGLLPGIGPASAQRIIDARNSAGPFKDLADLQRRIKGIGYKTAQRIEPYAEFH